MTGVSLSEETLRFCVLVVAEALRLLILFAAVD